MSSNPVPSLDKAYDASRVEDACYTRWEESGAFGADASSTRPPFVIMMPPPNVTGVLHMGHALNNTIQDIVIRHRRMLGHEALWLPGTDHAGIATQAVVEKTIYRETGVTREEMGRDAFLAEIWKWKEKHGNTILQQLRRLGCSCDWSRTKFTLDEDMSHAVRETFVRLWEKGLIYRGARLVNWDCVLQTAVSDDEILHVPRAGKLWDLRYPVQGRDGEFVTVATTRPETMLGDTGVAVHPDDDRYRDLVGQTLVLPLLDREIPVIADESVDPAFGSGAVKVTPGHDPADYDRGARHRLPIINILEGDGTMGEAAGPYRGLSREQAREAVLGDLAAAGLLGEVREIEHNVATSDRSRTAIEPLVSEQWFVRMEELARPAIAAVKTGRLRFKPDRWSSVYLDWLENVRDWCISRQLWWGHRIPVWYDEDGEPVASVDELEVGSPHPRTGKPIVRQDPDVLDTWASSWLWPFATLGWPERTDDLARFYPTHFLSTAREIIYLWVARMVMAGYELLDHLPEKDRCPFDLCYINPTVLDGQGRRMSKSLGNGIDPIEMIDRYGADAVRYSLMVLGREGQDVKLSENRFELGQRFANKIWNASRFVIRNLEGKREAAPGTDLEDEWIRSRLARVTEEVSAALTEYRFHDACQELYRFLWNDYCDWYLEVVKGRLAGEAGEASAARARGTLLEALRTVLALLHPIMPFLTEEIHRFLPGSKGLLMQSAWPTADPAARNLAAEGAFEAIQDVVSAVRNLRSRMSLPPSAVVSILVKTDDATVATALCESEQRIMALAGAKGVQAGPDVEKPAGSASALAAGGTVFVPLEGLIDLDVERARLGKERGRLENLVLQTERKLGNEQFVSRAKPEIVEREREKLGSLKADLERVAGAVADLG